MLLGSVLRIEHEENKIGRDFVIGDLHGSYKLLMKFMYAIGFDKKKDRLFSVGDLVDRGQQSLECLRLINEPWFFPVLGNHEQMMYCAIDPYGDREWLYANAFFKNGGSWISGYDVIDKRAELKDLCETLATMPRVRTIKGSNKVHIIHAELTSDVPITDAMIEDNETLTEMCESQAYDGDSSMWGRVVFGQFYNMPPENEKVKQSKLDIFNSDDLSLIISGHTIVKQPIRFGKLLNLDTGAWFSPRPLSVYDVQMQKIWQITPDVEDVFEKEPFVVIGS